MPIDWEKLEREIREIINGEITKTDDKLASKISSVTRLTDEEIKELFPEPADAEKIAQLMKIVKSAEDRNTKIDNIIGNIRGFAGVILTVMEKLA